MITNITSKEILIVEVKSIEVIENIQSNYDCFSRHDLNNECVLDLTSIGGEEEHNQLCETLGIETGSDYGIELSAGGYAVFFC